MEVRWSAAKRMKADSFWRDTSPSTNLTWTSMGTTNCCFCRKTESKRRNFGKWRRLALSFEGRRRPSVVGSNHRSAMCPIELPLNGRQNFDHELESPRQAGARHSWQCSSRVGAPTRRSSTAAVLAAYHRPPSGAQTPVHSAHAGLGCARSSSTSGDQAKA